MENKPKSFYRDGISIEESRVSALIIGFLVGFTALTYICVITQNAEILLSAVLGLITAIAGVNIAQAGIETLGGRREKRSDQTGYGQEAGYYENDSIDDMIYYDQNQSKG